MHKEIRGANEDCATVVSDMRAVVVRISFVYFFFVNVYFLFVFFFEII